MPCEDVETRGPVFWVFCGSGTGWDSQPTGPAGWRFERLLVFAIFPDSDILSLPTSREDAPASDKGHSGHSTAVSMLLPIQDGTVGPDEACRNNCA